MSKSERKSFLSFVLVLVLVPLGLTGAVVWNKMFRREETTFKDPAELFKYGAFGNVENQGMPYYIWFVLPRIFGEYLPGNGGYASLGFVSEPAHETPVGFAKETIGFPRVAFNCALCHSASFRTSPTATPIIVPAAPAHQADPQGYLQFLTDCVSDPRFNADVLLREIRQNVDLSTVDEMLYRYVLIPATKKALLEQRDSSRWMAHKPGWGVGRIDPFNPIKYGILGMEVDDTVGNADNMHIWNLRKREGQRLHWDGMNDSIHEVVLTSALGDGATLESINLERLEELENWLMDVKPPPFPGAHDANQAAQGKALFDTLCHDCHGDGGKQTGGVIPLADIGTDVQRHALWTQEAADRYNAYAKDYPFKFNHFRGTNGERDGYAAMPLDGVWLRAPYFHNGSVPSLWDVLSEPYAEAEVPAEVAELSARLGELRRRELRKYTDEIAQIEALIRSAREAERRPPMFFRGYDVVDTKHVGFVVDVGNVGEETQPYLYDTTVVGNGNRGHTGPSYGTTLSVSEKTALIEYLKTL